MVRKLLGILSAVLIYLCVATVIAQVSAVTAMSVKGALTQDRLVRVLAALHGIDIVTMHAEIAAEKKATEKEQASYEARIEAQKLKSLDLDLREKALEKGLLDITNLQTTLQTDQSRFQDLKQSYDAKLKELAEEEQSNSMRELQRTLEAMRPDQAKQQIAKMVEDDAMEDVVTILKNMAIDKRKKIIAEFKQGADEDMLFEILTNIRTGEPMGTQIQDTRDKLRQFGPVQ